MRCFRSAKRFEDELFLLLSHPFQLAQPAVAARGFELVERSNASCVYSSATVFGPTPCRCSRSRMVGGNCSSSSRW